MWTYRVHQHCFQLQYAKNSDICLYKVARVTLLWHTIMFVFDENDAKTLTDVQPLFDVNVTTLAAETESEHTSRNGRAHVSDQWYCNLVHAL